MPLVRRLIGPIVGVSVALSVAGSSAAPPVPSLEGTWLVHAGEGQSTLLLTCGADGSVAVAAPEEKLRLPDGTLWAVAPAGSGTWQSRGFPEAEVTAAFLSADPKNATPVLWLRVRLTLDATGQRWIGAPRWQLLDGSGRLATIEAAGETLTATRVPSGR